ncbi:hypothetical protein [Pseudoduganella sp. UC29_71]|uniref:hypothetical protein n=1 Tax=Pseudoduganella sp. UC29_71 TaxID=3350174 RepID=UPI00366DAB86
MSLAEHKEPSFKLQKQMQVRLVRMNGVPSRARSRLPGLSSSSHANSGAHSASYRAIAPPPCRCHSMRFMMTSFFACLPVRGKSADPPRSAVEHAGIHAYHGYQRTVPAQARLHRISINSSRHGKDPCCD